MKTKIKRHSRSAMSVVLAICMLISCMTVGLIATDAARSSDSVGAETWTNYKLHITTNNGSSWSYITFSSGGTASVTTTSTGTFQFEFDKNGTVYKRDSSQGSMSASDMNNSGNRYAKKSASSNWVVSSVPAGTYTFTLKALSGDDLQFTVTSAGSSSSSCSTGKTYRVVGTASIAGVAWDNTAIANNMTDSTGVGYYKKTYSNVAAGTHDFRIIEGSTWSNTWGFSRANKVDNSNIVTSWVVKPNDGDNNNIRMVTNQKANVEIRFDDSKSGTAAITVIVTPAIITVTAGSPYINNTATAAAGYIKVNDANSVTNVEQGGTVTVKAIAEYYYHFVSWRADNNLSFTNANAATTTASVAGSATVNANFAKDKYSITKSPDANCSLTTSANSVEWETSVTGTATPASGYKIDSITASYVDDEDVPHSVSVSYTAGTGPLNYSFTMPKGNVTVTATSTLLPSNTINYGVCSGQSAYGYVNVGVYHNSASTIKYTIDTNTQVLEGTEVNFCARPVVGKKFDGWYNTSAATGGTKLSSNMDYTVTSPSGNYYARFADAPDITTTTDDPVYTSSKYRLVFKASDYDNTDKYIYTFDGTSIGSWPGKKVSALSSATNGNGVKYYYVEHTSAFKYIMNNGNSGNGNQTGNQNADTQGTTRVKYPDPDTSTDYGTVETTSYTKVDITTTTSDPAAATTAYFPVKYYVNNKDKGNMSSTYTNAFVQSGGTATLYAAAADTSNWKYKRTTTGFTSDYTDSASTSASFTRTMPSSYSSSNPPTATITFVEKDYYPVTFSSGPNGTVKATTGSASGTEIKSGTMVKEGTTVYFTATAKTGYTFSKWTWGTSNTSTNNPYNTPVSAAVDRKGWFKKSDDKGTEISGKYLAYGTNINYQQWTTGLKLYHKNGRVYAYLDSPTNGSTYYFSVCDNNNPKSALAGDNLAAGCWGWNKTGTKCTTDFTAYLSNTGVQQYDVNWNYNDGQGDKYRGTNYYGKTTVADSSVSRLIFEVGEWNGSSLSFGDFYRVTPVYDTDVTNVDIYAKDGTYRGDSDYDYFPGIADTVLSAKSGSTVSNIKHQSAFDTGSAMRGQTIVVTTTIDSTHKGDFYIRGYSFNGVTPALLTASDGVANGTGTAYSQEYTIPADFDEDYLEITPIYYYKPGKHGVTTSNLVQFYIENYDKALEATGWGNTLSVYPYYQSGSSWVEKKQNAFGGYPGQPVIYYGGRRFVEIPTEYNTFTYDSGSEKACTIKGVTLSNDYWDIVHREYVGAVTEHKQTYDYDDFVKIYQETKDNQEKNGKTGLADQITFQFKYRTTTNNFADSSVTGTDKNTGNTSTGNTVHQPYSAITTTQKTNNFKNGWEPLLDYLDRPVDLFGKQLTDAQKQLDPILVVSDDYEVTYAGSYATTWTVYARSSSSATSYTKIAEIAPSALIVTSKARLDNTTLYPATADRGGLDPTTLQEYSSAYNTLLAYKERPVQITYESAIENNSSYEKYFNKSGVVSGGWISEKAVRNDGRWTYSYYNDDVNANILIQYKNDESETSWTTDTFKSGTNQGTVTAAKAYFTNTDLNKAGESFQNKTETGIVVSDQNKFYEFEATQTSGYVFAGWWFSRDGIETNVNEDLTKLTGHSQMTSNATFIARYIKAPTGTLTVNHTLSDGSVGEGTTYVKVVAINKTSGTRTLLTGDGTESDEMNDYTQDQFIVSNTYVGYKKDYRFEITLRTVTESDFDVFDRFSAASDEPSQNHFNGNYTESRNTSTGQDTVTSTSFTVDNDDMFAINASGYPEQTFDTLTYFSNIEHLNVGYSLTYTYNSKVGSNNYYGTQSYLVTGIFTEEEFNKYLSWDSALVTNDNETGWYKLNSKAGEFLATKAPHEATIRGNLNWDFTSSLGTVSYFKNNQTGGMDGQITVTKSAVQEEITTKRIQYIFPYRVTNTNDGTVAQKDGENRVVLLKDTDNPKDGIYSKYLTKQDATYAQPYALNWENVAQSGAEPIYVTAENMVYVQDENDSSEYTPQYFQYWSIETVPTGVETNQNNIPEEGTYVSHEVARCYNLGFNFSVYQDYIVRPVYSATPSTKEHTDSAAITWAENGRNQWNLAKGTAKWDYGDRIFTDFMVSYDRQDQLMLHSVTDKSISVGLITERLDTIQEANAGTAQEGKWDVQSEAYYNNKYASRDSDKSAISSYIQGRAATANVPGLPGIQYNTGTGKFVLDDADNYENSFINISELDNKNRIEFTKVVPNISQKDKSDTGRKNYVYRAYAYMIDWNMENGVPTTIKSVKISDPVYYTIYDIAMIENGVGISLYTRSND